jgi:hypothetical protein
VVHAGEKGKEAALRALEVVLPCMLNDLVTSLQLTVSGLGKRCVQRVLRGLTTAASPPPPPPPPTTTDSTTMRKPVPPTAVSATPAAPSAAVAVVEGAYE